jgi:hypothetical protein
MSQLLLKTAAVAAIPLLALTACGGASAAMPGAAAALRGSAGQDKIAAAKHYNLSGEYVGKFMDIGSGTGTAKASYTQYQNAVGGVLTIKYANNTITSSVALTVDGSATNGTTVAPASGSYCAFSTTGTYDPKTGVMRGSYQAVHGCTGGGGTFTLKQKCFYKYTGSEDIRPEIGPKSC